MLELETWLGRRDPDAFPYDAVVSQFHAVGKHFVPDELLSALDKARAAHQPNSDPASQLLARFLNTALDKWDGRFDNPSYLALSVLPLPGTGRRGKCPQYAQWQRDRLFVLLVADILKFELAAADGSGSSMPEIGPDAFITAKRCRLGVRAVMPVLERLGLTVELASSDPLTQAEEVCRVVGHDMTPDERRILRLSLLPVSLVHDEYMFARVLQCYENTFALVGVQISHAVASLEDDNAASAVRAIDAAEQAMSEASLLFSIIATMRAEAFLTFREFTDGASAIQSRNYKLIESLCREPEQARFDSPAFISVPEVRDRVLDGLPNIDDAVHNALTSGRLGSGTHALRSAMHRFESVIMQWRKTHYRLAVRMLGDRPGTGYTQGVPYLDEGREIPVFDPAKRAAESTDARGRARCPMQRMRARFEKDSAA